MLASGVVANEDAFGTGQNSFGLGTTAEVTPLSIATNDSADAWFIGCAQDPYFLCLATWMGYEFQNCQNVVGRACGGMKDVNGLPQVFGGTLPAEIFGRTFEIYRELRAARATGAPGVRPVAEVPADPT